VDNNVNKHNSYERNNRQAFSMDTGLVVFGTSTDIAVGSGDRSGADVYLAADSFEIGRLSSYREIARGAREFIRWAVKTFDRRG
jgi:hypothetical protein